VVVFVVVEAEVVVPVEEAGAVVVSCAPVVLWTVDTVTVPTMIGGDELQATPAAKPAARIAARPTKRYMSLFLL
jgi:hypothetical protein